MFCVNEHNLYNCVKVFDIEYQAINIILYIKYVNYDVICLRLHLVEARYVIFFGDKNPYNFSWNLKKWS